MHPAQILTVMASGMVFATVVDAQSRASITAEGVSTASIRGSIGTANDGQLIFGPFDAGFRANQICNGQEVLVGGMDTFLAVAIARHQCNDDSVGLFDSCGGHAQPYHYHEGMTCLYDGAASGHSTSVGKLDNGQMMYGKWEATNVLPELDACNGHFGFTPDSPTTKVYHYHVTDEAPFTAGCIGPATDAEGNEALVTVEQCRAVYGTCDGNTFEYTIASGTLTYDLDCPCFDKNERNYGAVEPLTYTNGVTATTTTQPPAPATAVATAQPATTKAATPADTTQPATTRAPATQPPTQPQPPTTPTTTVGECTVLKKAGVAYSGPVVAKYNNADGATPITDVAQCAQKCAENVECTYFAVNKSPSKGCVLKSNRRGSPVKHAAFLGHGTCAHPMPAGCATTNSGEGYSKFKKKNLGAFKSIKNDGGCAQKCAATAGCAYWVVHNRLGCVLNTEGAGRLQTKKAFMFQGTCTPAGSNE